MEKALNIISEYINLFIGIGGIVLGILIACNTSRLSNHKSQIGAVMNGERSKPSIRRKTGELSESLEKEVVTPGTIRNYEKEFNKTRSLYNMFSQLIPIFPLLGILGTVAGLMSTVVAENTDKLIASLSVALGSTLLGLIVAIGLKCFVVLFSGRIVDDVEIMLEDFYNRYNDAIAQNNILEE